MARSIEDRVPVELRRSSRISARIRNTIDEEKNDEPIGKQESAGSRKRKRASSDVDGLEDHDNDDDAQPQTPKYLKLSDWESKPAVQGIIDRSKLNVTVQSATMGGAPKIWTCPNWLRTSLENSRWTDGAAIIKFNKLRGQFIRRNTGTKRETRPRCTETEVAVLLEQLTKEVANIRCIRRCMGLDPEPLKDALSRVTANFNRKLVGKTAERGELYPETVRSVDRFAPDGSQIDTRQTNMVTKLYTYDARSEASIKSICKNIPGLKVIIDQEYVTGLIEVSDSDSEDDGEEPADNDSVSKDVSEDALEETIPTEESISIDE